MIDCTYDEPSNRSIRKYNEYIQTLKSGNIPLGDITEYAPDVFKCYRNYETRRASTRLGIWPIIESTWLDELAQYIGNRTCFEIMAGSGVLTKALNDRNVKCTASDNMSWSETHTELVQFTNIEIEDAEATVDRHNRMGDTDILIVSWPPLDDPAIEDACIKWDGIIIHIGESCGGCTGTEAFNDRLLIDYDQQFSYNTWAGIHDDINVCWYNKS